MVERRVASPELIGRVMILIGFCGKQKLIFHHRTHFFADIFLARPGCARAPAGSPLANLARH